MFEKFDFDNSGSIESKEMLEMFKLNGVNITESELIKIFNIVDSKKSGSLSVD